MNIRRNCGVFDEGTKKCIACGEYQEGDQCKYEVWSYPQCCYYAAQLLGIPTVLTDNDTKVAIVSDSTTQRQYGMVFDPHRAPGQLMWLIDRLIVNYRCRIQYNPDLMQYEVSTNIQGHLKLDEPANVLPTFYNLNVAHRVLSHAIILAAAKHYCNLAHLPLPHNLLENKL